MFVSERYLGEGRHSVRSIEYRVDNGPPADIEWLYKNHSAASFNRDGKTDQFLYAIENGSSLVVRAYTFDYAPVTALFALKGVPLAIAQIGRYCK